MATDLAQLDGNRYDYSYYMYLVWLSLELHWPNAFDSSTIIEWKNKYDIVKNNPLSFNCN